MRVREQLLCRCAAYPHIVKAIKQAAREMER
jgi:aerobic-type carbon monoxide dehydrogenase small subunit (CoxS/CutS family)